MKPDARFLLVPKLHFGTHSEAQLHCAGSVLSPTQELVARARHATLSFARKAVAK